MILPLAPTILMIFGCMGYLAYPIFTIVIQSQDRILFITATKVLKDDLHTYSVGAGKIVQPVKDNRHHIVLVYCYRATTAVGLLDIILRGLSKNLFSNAACTLCYTGDFCETRESTWFFRFLDCTRFGGMLPAYLPTL
jgi:hypothetical protein